MTIKADKWIRRMALEQGMIEPFVDGQIRKGVISYGLSSYGYDIRVSDEFKIFTNVWNGVVDPKNFDPACFVDFKGDVCVIPPNSFVLAQTIEYFRIPRDVLTICVGKCVTGDTRVVDAKTGAYIPIAEAANIKTTIGMNKWKPDSMQVVDFIPNGKKPVYELTTKAGLKIQATANHPFRQLFGWTPLADLQPGDRIAVAREVPVFGSTPLPDWEAILLGLMISEGQFYTPGHSPVFTTADPVLAALLEDCTREGFAGEVSYNGNYGYRLVNRLGQGGIPEANRAYQWLQKYGLNVHAHDKFVPQAIFTAPKDTVVLFLQALFAGDGSIYTSGKGIFLEYYSNSRRLIEDVHHLLLRFGVFALIREKQTAVHTTAYRLQITDREQIHRFLQEIGFWPGSLKQCRVEDEIIPLLQRRSTRQRSNFDTLPREGWLLLRDTADRAGISLHSIGILRTLPTQSLPYSVANALSTAVGDTNLSQLVHYGPIWDTVKDIKFVGEKLVYDLTVPEFHNFVANDLIVHNSTYARCGLIVNVTPFEPCFSADTEILTRNGWRTFDQIVIGTEVLTMNQEGIAEWQQVVRHQAYPYVGDLIHFDGKSIDLMVTPDHHVYVDYRSNSRANRWRGWQRQKAGKVYGHHNYRMSRRVNWEGEDIEDKISIGGREFATNAFLSFFGMYLGDGSCYKNKGGYVIKLAAIKEGWRESARQTIEALGFSPNYDGRSWCFFSKELYEFLHPLGHKTQKNIPKHLKNLPPYRLHCLLDGLMQADGNEETRTYTTTSKQLADDVQEIMFKVGSAAIVRQTEVAAPKVWQGREIISRHPVYKIRQVFTSLTPKIRPSIQKCVPYRGMVYDITVPNHIIFVRRNGKPVWSGNCWEGYVTLEISNTTPLPARVYANEGIAQVLFFQSDEECETSYADKKGKYQKQQTIVLPKID